MQKMSNGEALIFMFLLNKENKTEDERVWFEKFTKKYMPHKCVCA